MNDKERMTKVYYDLRNNSVPPMGETDFDQLLQSEWRDRMSKGLFRYHFKKPEAERKLNDGKYGFLAQYCPLRSTNRRTPQSILSVNTPFDSQKFHFGKVNESEVLFNIRETNVEDPRQQHSVLINVSPFEAFHSLLVTDIQSKVPQKLSFKAIELALRIIFQSGSGSLRLAFNSLCAYASVNHCHWHIYYLSRRTSYIQTCPLIPLHDSFLWEFEDYSAPGFVFIVSTEKEIIPMSRKINAFTSFLTDKSIAHNVIMVRGENNEIRIIVWARNSVFGNKDPGAFGIAVCELGGQILIYAKDKYDVITEREVIQAHHEATSPYFENVKAELKNIPF